ncbi:MAG: hypothetical protein ACI8VC_001766 [Candidatus Endobugula sp.]|jgi:hypothetical protein
MSDIGEIIKIAKSAGNAVMEIYNSEDYWLKSCAGLFVLVMMAHVCWIKQNDWDAISGLKSKVSYDRT